MAKRTETITITHSAAATEGAEPRPAGHSEKRPRNLPAAGVATEGFALLVDGKAKSHYGTAAAAVEAGTSLKRAFPMLQVMVYDAVEKTRSHVDGPAGTSDAASQTND